MIVRLGALAAVVGAVAAAGSGWYIVRGPFFGGPLPALEFIIPAIAVFILGLLLFAWGAGIVENHVGSERPDIDEEHDHTMDWIRR